MLSVQFSNQCVQQGQHVLGPICRATDLFLAPSILDLLPLPSHLALCEEDLEVEEEDEEKRDEK